MKIRMPRIGNPIATAVAGLLAGMLLVGVATAVTSSTFKYSSPKTGYLSLGPSDFTIDGTSDSADGTWFNGWGGTLSNDNLSRCFNTGVRLPQGAKVKSFTAYYTSGPNTDLVARWIRQDPATGNNKTVSADPADDTGVRTSVTRAIPGGQQKINNSKYQYMLGFCFYDDTDFHGVRVKYTYTSAGD